MNVIPHPASVEVALRNARAIIKAPVGTYPEDEVLFACHELTCHGDFIDTVTARIVQDGIECRAETKRRDETLRALRNVYPPLWSCPSAMFGLAMLVAALGAVIAWVMA